MWQRAMFVRPYLLVATIAHLSLSRERHMDSSGMTKLNLVELALDIPPPKVQGPRSKAVWAAEENQWKPVLARQGGY
jgi:hypothetical protein